MSLLTQNSDLRQGGIYGWTLPAHWVKLSDGTKFNACPNAGVCGAFCYAKSGTYQFSNVKNAHLKKLEWVLSDIKGFSRAMIWELQQKQYIKKFIRIHDAGDFFSKEYAEAWLTIAKLNPHCNFYAYTKEVKMFKDLKKEGKLPGNFTTIFSFGGRQDNLIDRETDRHSDVFHSKEALLKAGYYLMGDDDSQASINPNHKIGLYRNNIPHLIKKMQDKSFSEWQKK